MKRQQIEQLLPGVIRGALRPGDPMGAVLDVIEALHAPSEAVLASLEQRFDPRRAPDSFVPFLARWVDLDHLFEEGAVDGGRLPEAVDSGALRELVALAVHLSRWRGTHRGLILFLETATGVQGFHLEEHILGPDGTVCPFHLRITAPESVRPRRALVEKIIEREKPAYVTYELRFGAEAPGGRPTEEADP